MKNYIFKALIPHLFNSEPIFQYLSLVSAVLLILIDFYFLASTVFILFDSSWHMLLMSIILLKYT